MEDNHDIDEIFRENLERFEMDPPGKVWASIETELDKKRKSRGFLFLWIGLVIGLIGLGTFGYLEWNSKLPDTSTVNTTVPEEKTGATENMQSNVPLGGRENSPASTSESIHIENATVNGSAASSPAEKIIPAQTVAENNIAPPAVTDTKANMRKHTPVTSSPSGGKQPASTSQANMGGITNNADAPVNVFSGNNSSSPRTMGSGQVENALAQNTPKKISADEKAALENIPAASENNSSEALKNSETPSSGQRNDATISDSPVPSSALKNIESKTTPGENNSNVAATAVNDSTTSTAQAQEAAAPGVKSSGLKSLLKRIAGHSSIGLFYSPDYAVNRTTGVNNADSRTTGYSWSSGLRMGYDLSHRWSISVGASYSSYSKSESFSNVYVTSDSAFKEMHHDDHDHDFDHGHGGGGGWGGGHGGGGGGGHDGGGPGNDGSHYVVHTSCGDIDFNELPPQCTGDEESGDTLSLQTDVVSTVEFINVPLKLRFNIRSRKLLYYAEIGASMNFITNSSAKISIGSYSENNAVSGLTNFNYSALLNIGVEYRFYKGLSLFLEPNLRYSVTPINDSGSEKSFPYFIGGNAGLSIHF